MAGVDRPQQRDLPAGDFSAWLTEMQRALRGERSADVPCDGCTACCTSSQFIDIGPDETDTLARIPAELLFPAPHRPPGHLVLGYDEQGHCPMLVDDTCSIYEHRPTTCRTYDCRVFPAAGVGVDDGDGDHDARDATKVRIAQRVRRWRFSFPTDADRTEHDAVRAAATFLGEHADVLPERVAPTNATGLAVLAIELHDAFLRRDDDTDRMMVTDPDPQAVQVELRRRTKD